jgi:CBS domain-containing protein
MDMRAREIMTREPACCTPDTSAEEAARMMREHDCGVIPVVEDESSRTLVGVVTDRDIALRGVGEGRGPEVPVRELMTRTPEACSPDDDVREVERVMMENKVRRVPIIDAGGQLVGIIAQADVALKVGNEQEVGELVEHISEPRRPLRMGQAD